MLEKLSNLILDTQHFDVVDERMHQFCPFEAIGMVRQEIRHSNFLAYLLDPSRPHGMSEVALRTLLMVLAGDEAAERLDYHFREISSARVWRERDHIDILIEIPSNKSKGLIIAIEIKVDASERQGQLSDYSDRIRSRYPSIEWHHVFCFLTPDGRTGSTQGNQTWRSLSFGDLLAAIEAAISRAGIAGEGARLFDNYHTMMKRHDIVEDTSDPELERAVQAIWAKHKEALEYLFENRPDVLNALIKKMDEKQAAFAENLSKTCKTTVVADQKVGRYRRFSFPDMAEECPQLFSGNSGWIRSKAQLVLEVTVENEEIIASIAVGRRGEDIAFRPKLIEEMNKVSETNLRQGDGVKHYWRKGILTFADLADEDNHLTLLDDRLTEFVSGHIADVKKALLAASAT